MGEGAWSGVGCEGTKQLKPLKNFISHRAQHCAYGGASSFSGTPWKHCLTGSPLSCIQGHYSFSVQGEHLEYRIFAPRELPGSSHPRRLYAVPLSLQETSQSMEEQEDWG